MSILTIGVHDLIGSNLVRAPSPENTIYGPDTVALKKDGIVETFSRDDLGGIDLPQVNTVIHLAGRAHDTRNKSTTDVYFKVDAGLTQCIFDWSLPSKSAKKFIFFSAVKSASDKVEDKCLTEECVPTPAGPYGEGKIRAKDYIVGHFASEALKRPYHNLDDDDSLVKGKNVYIIRPCIVHGPGNKGNFSLLYGVVNKGVPRPLGAFENCRLFTSIGNLCVVIGEFLIKNAPSGIHHMGDNEALSTNELARVTCEALGKKARIWHIPKGLTGGVVKVGGWFYLPLNPLRIQKLTENYVMSNARVKVALGTTRVLVRTKDGLMDITRSFK